MKITSVTVGDFADQDAVDALIIFVRDRSDAGAVAITAEKTEEVARATTEPVPNGEKPKRKPRRTKKEMEAARAEAEKAKSEGAAGGAEGVSGDTGDAAQGDTGASVEARGTGGSTPRRRRGQPATEAATTSTRRPRRPRAEQIAADNAADPEAAKKADALVAAAEAAPSSAIKDKDLTTAASHAAQEIAPAGVNAVLEQYGVAQVNDLKAEVRQEFLDTLKDAVKNKVVPF